MKFMIVLILFFSSTCLRARQAINDTSRVRILLKIVSIQFEFSQLKSMHNFLIQDSSQHESSGYSEYHYLLNRKAWRVSSIDSSLSSLGIIGYTFAPALPKSPNAIVTFSSEPTYYSLAVAKSGTIFLLRGFWNDDFRTMVKEEIGKRIDKASAIAVALFYMRNVLYPLGRTIIDSTINPSTLSRMNPKIHYPTVRMDKTGNFHVSICDVEPRENVSKMKGEFVNYRFIVGRFGSFSCLHPKIVGAVKSAPTW